jgi:hypothetical protein
LVAGLGLGQTVGDRALRKIGMPLLVRDGVDESQQFAIALLDTVNLATREKAVAQETDLALDAPLLVASVGSAQSQLDVHGTAEVEEQRMKASHIAVALKHDDLGIVEQPPARATAEEGRGSHKRAQERVHGGVEAEFAPHGARPCQHHDEEPQRAGAASRNWDLPDMRPVDLGLFADERVEAQEGFVGWRGTHRRDKAPQGAFAAEIATLFDHVENPGRAQAWILLERLLDESVVRCNQERRSRWTQLWREQPENAPYNIVMDAKLGGDRAYFPMLGVKQPRDLRLDFGGDGHGRPPGMRLSWRKSRNSPTPASLVPRRRGLGSTTSTLQKMPR